MIALDWLKQLEQFCHINDIPRTAQWKSAGQSIIENPERAIIAAARHGYILQAFQRLVRGEIDEETFFGTGEIRGTEPVAMPDTGNELVGWLQIQQQLQKNDYPVSLVIVDDVINLFAPQSVSLLKQAEEKGLVVVHIS